MNSYATKLARALNRAQRAEAQIADARALVEAGILTHTKLANGFDSDAELGHDAHEHALARGRARAHRMAVESLDRVHKALMDSSMQRIGLEPGKERAE